MTDIIDKAWLADVNNTIDQILNTAVETAGSELEYHAERAIEDQIDVAIDQIRMDTGLSFNNNDEVKEQMRIRIRDAINQQHRMCLS